MGTEQDLRRLQEHVKEIAQVSKNIFISCLTARGTRLPAPPSE